MQLATNLPLRPDATESVCLHGFYRLLHVCAVLNPPGSSVHGIFQAGILE